MSGFDTDPQFEIIMMPEHDEHAASGDYAESEEYLDAQDATDRAEISHDNGDSPDAG